MRIEYVARDRLVAGFVSGNAYEIAGPHESHQLAMNVKSFGTESTDGSQETDLEGIRDEYSVTTVELDDDGVDLYLMFIASHAAGQAFTIDLRSDLLGVPVKPQVAKLTPGQNIRPNLSNPQKYKLSFRIRIV